MHGGSYNENLSKTGVYLCIYILKKTFYIYFCPFQFALLFEGACFSIIRYFFSFKIHSNAYRIIIFCFIYAFLLDFLELSYMRGMTVIEFHLFGHRKETLTP